METRRPKLWFRNIQKVKRVLWSKHCRTDYSLCSILQMPVSV